METYAKPPETCSKDRRNHPTTIHARPTPVVNLYGRPLIPPQSALARALVMGNNVSNDAATAADDTECSNTNANNSTTQPLVQRPASNLTILLSQREEQEQQRPHQQLQLHQSQTSPANDYLWDRRRQDQLGVDEADSGSEPRLHTRPLGSSAPLLYTHGAPDVSISRLLRQHSTGEVSVPSTRAPPSIPSLFPSAVGKPRRCLSSKELITIAPPSGSPYAFMLSKKEELEVTMRERLQALRISAAAAEEINLLLEDSSSTSSSRRRETSNVERNRRRAQHTQAVLDDLCEVVADLFLAESKLINPSTYLLPPQESSDRRPQIVQIVRAFLTNFPPRYALSADTPSEVLLHMRLMAAVRSDPYKVAVHIHNLNDDERWKSHALAIQQQQKDRSLRLVTISCHDAVGLLEYISKLLATSGSRVLDADVMLTKDGIVLDRFVVEMNGRLRLDTLANLVEAFIREYYSKANIDPTGKNVSSPVAAKSSQRSESSLSHEQPTGPLYFQEPPTRLSGSRSFQLEMKSAVPLSDMLASSQSDMISPPQIPHLLRISFDAGSSPPTVNLPMRKAKDMEPDFDRVPSSNTASATVRQRRPLVNRRAAANLDDIGLDGMGLVPDTLSSPPIDYLAVDDRSIPLIPFDEIMLIETVGTGRVSTIYRAAWQRSAGRVQMVALKVAMISGITGDTANVDELRREADIAARLNHSNICDLVGIAADSECFCLAYEYCEGGSLLSLLTDSSRYYEYLPIALDIANGMAYLHSRNVIHRDLKPSNILLTRDHRAKISDFGMSVANFGQELTAETGTYRYMAPEVIRHESYSSNADVYSFGICLWQLITREIPFANMTPIQAAYAVAEGRRPEIPMSTPKRLQEIIIACWDQDSHKRPSFTYIAMALADYAKMAFSPANVGALTLQIANEMLATVEGNSTVNVDISTPVSIVPPSRHVDFGFAAVRGPVRNDSQSSTASIGLDIE